MAPSEAGRTGAPTHGGTEPRVLIEVGGGVATLTLNRPDKRNALDRQMITELKSALTRCDLSADVRLVVVRAAGKDFCAGLDLEELLASADLTPAENERRSMELGELFVMLREMPKVSVAVVAGRALAGGCGLATACDLVVARAGAQFGYPEIQRGFVPAMVMTMLRRSVGEKIAFDLAATGRLVSAEEAERLGLISRLLPADDFEVRVTTLLAQLAMSSPSALALIKQQLHQVEELGFEAGVTLGARVNSIARATPEFRKSLESFLQKG